MIVFAQKIMRVVYTLSQFIIITPRKGQAAIAILCNISRELLQILDEFAAGIGGQAAVQVIDDVIVRPEERNRAVFPRSS